MIDYSFLRFIDNFDKAKDLKNSMLAQSIYDNQIHLNPNEPYSIITNVINAISFNGNIKAYLVDCKNNILEDISDRVYIEEFNHNYTGLKQCKIELIPMFVDYLTDLVYLRLDHDVLNGKSYWSNPFIISEYDLEETIRFDFKNYQNLDGTCYEVANIYQSIRLKAIKQKNTFTSSSQSYTTLEGNKLSSRLIKTKFYDFVMDMNNDFIYDRIQYLLSHDELYVDGIRVTDKQTFENDDKYSNTTNVSQNKFKVAVNENDIFNYAYQIFEPLNLILKVPDGVYNTISIPIVITGTFNRNIALGVGFLKLYKNGVLFSTFDESDITIVGETFTINIPGLITLGGQFYITISPGLFISELNEVYQGISNATDWDFIVSDGYFNQAYFNSTYYNTD